MPTKQSLQWGQTLRSKTSALPNRAQTIAPRALPFNLAPLDARGVSMAIAVSVIRSSNHTYAQLSPQWRADVRQSNLSRLDVCVGCLWNERNFCPMGRVACRARRKNEPTKNTLSVQKQDRLPPRRLGGNRARGNNRTT